MGEDLISLVRGNEREIRSTFICQAEAKRSSGGKIALDRQENVYLPNRTHNDTASIFAQHQFSRKHIQAENI